MKNTIGIRTVAYLLLAFPVLQMALPDLHAGEPCPPPAADSDGDGVCDDVDNCPAIANPFQADSDEDGAGAACDACDDDPDKTEPGACGCGVADIDSDEDGLLDCSDNCPLDANADQADADGDGVGDFCDECEVSVTGGTVVIEKCDSLINNAVSSNGCTFVDDVNTCIENASNHGKFVSCIAKASKRWSREGLLVGRERSRVIICAARSDIGRQTTRDRIGR